MDHRMESASSYHSYLKSPYKSVKHTTYFQIYDELFCRYRGKKITFVEIGVLDGGSLFMWRDFFGSEARIIGIDLNPGAKKWEEDGFEIFVGSQSNPNFWESFFASIGNVDIILDDGGHTFEQQIVTAECCIPFVNNDGILVVEDTHTSYMPGFGGPAAFSFVSYAKNIVDGINFRFSELAKSNNHEPTIYSVRFFESFVVFDVRREHCNVLSEPTDNGGKSAGAEDFRYADNSALTKFQSLGFSFRHIKNIPLIGPLAAKIFHFLFSLLHRFFNFLKKRALKKIFKY